MRILFNYGGDKVMKVNIRSILSILLILALVIGTGFSSFGNDEEIVEPENMEESMELNESEEIKEPKKLEEIEKPMDEKEISNDQETNVSGELDDSKKTEDITRKYTVKYFIDKVEQKEWQMEGEIPIDNPIVEEVSHDNMPEGYTLDEEKSTILPFEVREENSIIEVHYAMDDIEDEFIPMVVGGLESEYYRDSALFPLYMHSTNNHTRTVFAWLYNGELYLAIGSMHNKPLQKVVYQGKEFLSKSANFHRASNENEPLKITSTVTSDSQNYYIKDYIPQEKPYWNVVNLGNVALVSPFTLEVRLQGGGHEIVGIDNIEVTKSILVYHRYGDEEPILDIKQSGLLNDDLSYNVHPEYIYGGMEYALTDIEVLHNGILQEDRHLNDNGNLTGTVEQQSTNTGLKANAIITFIYEVKANGKLIITKDVSGLKPGDKNKEFHIFVYGPKGTYTVSLKHGESEAIEGLEYGTYTIKEIVPMRFELESISPKTVSIDKDNKEKSVTVTNKRSNDGWFDDDDNKDNIFKMATTF